MKNERDGRAKRVQARNFAKAAKIRASPLFAHWCFRATNAFFCAAGVYGGGTGMKRGLLVLAVLLAGCGKKVVSSAESQFEQMMNGAVLVGRSTLDGKDGLSGEERYSIDHVSKVGGDVWMFQARMKLEGHEIPVPIPVTIKWAGDTPVIEVTDMAIPGMGSYTARVVLYRDRYAGTWSGKNHGGQLFGAIVHNK
jgi:hypothetical protein